LIRWRPRDPGALHRRESTAPQQPGGRPQPHSRTVLRAANVHQDHP
jgi:hypothetical protein